MKNNNNARKVKSFFRLNIMLLNIQHQIDHVDILSMSLIFNLLFKYPISKVYPFYSQFLIYIASFYYLIINLK